MVEFIHSFEGRITDSIRIRIPLALVIFLSVSVIYNTFVILCLGWSHVLNFKHYTYWNYLIVTIFDLLYLSTWFTSSHSLFKCMNVIVFPIVMGSTAIVNILIIVILQNNDWIMVSASVFGEGQLPLGKIHLVDYIIHGLPFLSRFVALILGQQDIVRQYVYAYLHNHIRVIFNLKNFRTRRLAYFCYWLVCPLIPVAIYSSINNPFVEYPTNFTILEATIILLSITLLFQIITYFAVYTATVVCAVCEQSTQHFAFHLDCINTSNRTTYIRRKEKRLVVTDINV